MTDPTPGPEGQPQDPYGPPPTNPYGAPPSTPPTGQPGYGQPPSYGAEPGAQPYGGYAQPGYPQQGYPQGGQPGYPAAPYGYAPPRDHPKATHALVWGLVSLIGGFICALPLLASPVAWVIGVRARREIDAQPGLGGRGQATAGMVMGIIGTVLLALAIAFVVLIVVLAVSGSLDSSSGYDSGTDF